MTGLFRCSPRPAWGLLVGPDIRRVRSGADTYPTRPSFLPSEIRAQYMHQRDPPIDLGCQNCARWCRWTSWGAEWHPHYRLEGPTPSPILIFNQELKKDHSSHLKKYHQQQPQNQPTSPSLGWRKTSSGRTKDPEQNLHLFIGPTTDSPRQIATWSKLMMNFAPCLLWSLGMSVVSWKTCNKCTRKPAWEEQIDCSLHHHQIRLLLILQNRLVFWPPSLRYTHNSSASSHRTAGWTDDKSLIISPITRSGL